MTDPNTPAEIPEEIYAYESREDHPLCDGEVITVLKWSEQRPFYPESIRYIRADTAPREKVDPEALRFEVCKWAKETMDVAHSQFGTLSDLPMARMWILNTISYLETNGYHIVKDGDNG